MAKKILLGVLALALLIQFIRPSHQNPPVDPAVDFKTVANPPAEVLQVLQAACYDCHSNESKYPWYAQISPVSWWIADHINEGREKLNFSEFGKLSAEDKAEALEEAGETVQKGEMPLDSYTWMHPEAKLTAQQRTLLTDWFAANGGEGNEAAGEGGNTAGEQGEGGEKDDD